MNITYENTLGSERTVEQAFVRECLEKYYCQGDKILDVGGIASSEEANRPIMESIKELGADYRVCDFRGGQYQGDFVRYPFKEKFDIIVFLSSLEHFPQCTEGDMIYRHGEDRRGFQKAQGIRSQNGIIVITVPFGKARWQPYHQNYDMSTILELSQGSKVIEKYTYRLVDNIWVLTKPENMTDVLYTDRAYGVGCFVFA